MGEKLGLEGCVRDFALNWDFYEPQGKKNFWKSFYRSNKGIEAGVAKNTKKTRKSIKNCFHACQCCVIFPASRKALNGLKNFKVSATQGVYKK
jgi:hypothetical protein